MLESASTPNIHGCSHTSYLRASKSSQEGHSPQSTKPSFCLQKDGFLYIKNNNPNIGFRIDYNYSYLLLYCLIVIFYLVTGCV